MKTFKEYTQESSLSRIKSKVDDYSCGAITAFRNEFTKAENKTRNKELLAALKVKGYSVTKVKGSYIENFGSEDAKEVGEETWFVCNEKVEGDDKGQLEKDLKKLGEKYDQDSILSIRNGKANLIGTSHRDNAFPSFGQSVAVGSGKYGKKSGEFFSRVKGREFAFEEVEVTSIMGKWGMKIVGETIWKEID
jgi:hypothetical protein